MPDTLEIVPYDPTWPDQFEAERRRLAATLGPLASRIDHHGSTSVPGLAAKPVIDIQVSVSPLHPLEPYLDPLRLLGYIHMPHADDAFAPFLHRPASWPHTHHVHLVEAGGEEERKTLAFRDYLRDHPEAMREYESLKRALAPNYSSRSDATRQAYADAKTEFITTITQKAFASGYPATKSLTSPPAR